MTTQTLAYQLDGQAFDIYYAVPEGPGPHPAVMVIHAWGGRQELMEDKARALAKLGYVGAAIDLYGVGKRGTDKASSDALMTPLLGNPEQLRKRLRAALAQVQKHEAVDDERVAAIGFCFGGLCAIVMARMGLPLRAVVSFHGLLKIGEALNERATAKLLILHGQDDPMVPSSDLVPFANEMQRIGADWQLHAYPGVKHAFTNPKANDPDFGTVYDADADRRSWQAMRRFLEDFL